MILCAQCGKSLIGDISGTIICNNCGHEIAIIEGNVMFHPEQDNLHSGMESFLHDDLFKYENKHFWARQRIRFISQIFDTYVARNNKIIEIGAGTGGITRHLSKKGYEDLSVGEVHLSGLEYARSYGIKNRYQFDLTKTPFLEHFDVVGMFDVLEHIDDDELAVENIYRMLKPGGKAIVTVPAHKWLWSKQDAIAYHRRRYEVDQLKDIFERNSFNILEARAFFVSILPLLFLRKLIDRDNGALKDRDFENRFKVNPFINLLLERLLALENNLLRDVSLKWGGSIILVAVKS